MFRRLEILERAQPSLPKTEHEREREWIDKGGQRQVGG